MTRTPLTFIVIYDVRMYMHIQSTKTSGRMSTLSNVRYRVVLQVYATPIEAHKAHNKSILCIRNISQKKRLMNN